jgi:hypothetical protein
MPLSTASSLSRSLAAALDPLEHARQLGFEAHSGQAIMLKRPTQRILVCACRQYGKSTTEALLGTFISKSFARSLTLIFAPTEKQSSETMMKSADFIMDDPAPVGLKIDNRFEKVFTNGSRIVALPGSEKSVRGYSAPRLIILDEASRIPDAVYKAIRPMLARAPEADLVAMTTPYGKRGWFYQAWSRSKRWTKVLVRVAWEPRGLKLVPSMPEDEFRAYWAERGVIAFYSPFHSREFLEEELEAHGELWFRQEYCCDFVETEETVFRLDDILDAESEHVVQLLTGDEEGKEEDGLERVVVELDV